MNPQDESRGLSQRSTPYLFVAAIFLVVFALCLRAEYQLAGKVGFALDDSWIHAAMARNLVEGKGFGVNPGYPLAMSSSPAWTLSLAFFYSFTGDAVTAGLMAALLYMVAAGLLICRLTVLLGGSAWAGAVAAVALLLDEVVLWGYASGMEIPLVTFAVVLFLYCYYAFPPDSRVRSIAVPLTVALAASTRPELFILAPLAMADTWSANISGISKKRAWKILALQAVVLTMALAPYFAFDLGTTGRLFPTTYYAKTEVRNIGFMKALKMHDYDRLHRILTRESVNELLLVSREFMQHNFLVFMLVPVGLLAFLKRFSRDGRSRGWLLAAVLVLLPLAMGVMTPSTSYSNYAGRYFAPFVPMIALAAALGLSLLASWMEGGASRRLTILGGCVLMGLLYMIGFQGTLNRLGKDVANTEKLYVDMGKWVAANVDLDEGECIAVNDIGGFSYFSGKCALDIMGLASPEVWPILEGKSGKERQEALHTYLRERGMHYLIVSPRYYPSLTKENDLTAVKKFTGKYRTRRQISPQVIYEIRDGLHPADGKPKS